MTAVRPLMSRRLTDHERQVIQALNTTAQMPGSSPDSRRAMYFDQLAKRDLPVTARDTARLAQLARRYGVHLEVA